MAFKWQNSANGAASGAAMGSMIMPGWGTAIGGVAGGLMGAFGGGDDEGGGYALPMIELPERMFLAG
jgi:hypothetical protein